MAPSGACASGQSETLPVSMRFLSVHCFVRVCGLGLRVCKGLGLGFRALGFNKPKGRVYRFRASDYRV